MTTDELGDIYYDPFDTEIDIDPYPLWKRMRNEAPLYFNEKYGFRALSRFADVDTAIVDWETYRSGRGTVLNLVLAGVQFPPGMFIFEDPPAHDVHRSVLTRVFTPRKMNALEPQVRTLCARILDPLTNAAGFDLIGDVGMELPIRVIGMLLGISEQDQDAIRGRIEKNPNFLHEAHNATETLEASYQQMFAEYIDWRTANPADDVITELLFTEFEDQSGVRRRLSREEALSFVLLLAGAGSDTTRQLIGWLGKLLAEHQDQRRDVVADRSLITNTIEEALRYEAPSPVQTRVLAHDVSIHGQTLPEGSVVVLLNGAANRDERRFTDPDRFDVHRKVTRHLSFGRGIHLCIGAALARLEGRVVLDEVLNRFPDWHVDWERAEQAHTPTTRGWRRLPLVIN
jgi:cytochrome P450